METAKKRQAKVNGFVEARFAEGLNSEVLQNGKDLWLVQVPQNLDLSSLNGVQLKMKECKNEFCLKSENGESKEFRFQSLRSPGGFALVPDVREGEAAGLAPAQFQGELKLSRCINVPCVPIKDIPLAQKPSIPAGLKTRWKPFGWQSPHVVPSKRERKRKPKVRDSSAKKAKKFKKSAEN
eukprot:m.21943 g.21943  ORF g.21943 m.21943 type:complete len:181 (+) comp28246_c0_seq4:1-543(+)